jgi:hypothetical protein
MNKILRSGATVYCLNDHGVDTWRFFVEAGMTEEGRKTFPSVVKKVATKMAAVDDLYAALEEIYSRLESSTNDDLGMIDGSTMQYLMDIADVAMAKARGEAITKKDLTY